MNVSVVTWSNSWEQYQSMLLLTLASPYQLGYRQLQPIVVIPDAGAQNIGQAYNMGRAIARHELCLFAHQDVKIQDRHFFEKLDDLFLDPKVGAVGIIGSTVDTGAGFFHTRPKNKRGQKYGGWYPERAKVAIVDGFLLATKLDLPFSEEYESTHMTVEDYCMRVREAGYEVWVLDCLVEHASPGTLDPAYWRSVATFRRKWKHALPADILPITQLKKRVDLVTEAYKMEVSIEVVGASDDYSVGAVA